MLSAFCYMNYCFAIILDALIYPHMLDIMLVQIVITLLKRNGGCYDEKIFKCILVPAYDFRLCRMQ